MALPCRTATGIGAFGGEDFDAFSDMDNFGARMKTISSGDSSELPRRREELALADGAVDLASVGVAADADVEGAKAVLRGIFDFGGEQDCAGAGAESGLGVDEFFQLVESGFAEELQEGPGFAAGDDEAVDVVELLRAS